jgi:hypothetical protein
VRFYHGRRAFVVDEVRFDHGRRAFGAEEVLSTSVWCKRSACQHAVAFVCTYYQNT